MAIRIIDMRESTCGNNNFAIWDTVIYRFVEFNGEQSFDGVEGLKECFNDEPESTPNQHRDEQFLERVIGLLPDWAKEPTDY